ncbi:MAG: hypothetical protein P1S60_12360 [Anaerolineae bacterium]|nr:hypothetical protein [Anaerolineae bacterium]
MAVTYIFIALIAVGTIVAIQGLRILRSQQKPRVSRPERVLMGILAGDKPEEQLQVLGRLRIAMGILLALTGIWVLFS